MQGKYSDMDTDNNGKERNYRDLQGRFTKDNPGRPSGAKSKLRQALKDFVNDNLEHLPEWFSKLKPKDKITVMLDLMPYCISRLQSISMSDTEGNDLPPSAMIDFTKLSEATLKEILSNTHIQDEN